VAATLQAAGDRGSPGSVLDAVDEQRLPRPVSRRQDPAGGEPNRARPWPIVLDAGRQATSCRGWGDGAMPVGIEAACGRRGAGAASGGAEWSGVVG
jgi:hypothetical protein